MNRTGLVWCACVVRKGLTIHCGSWGLSCCLLSRAGGNRIRVPNFRMTAHTVILAQTRVGFLTGGRKKYFLALPEEEQMVQLEEAYARATVAITRAVALCLIMGPLDMKGLLGVATVMGTLMYGAGHVWAGRAHFYLHDHELAWRAWSTAQNQLWQLRQPAPGNFLVNKECLWTCMPKSERKNKSYLFDSPAVSKMYPWGGERRGSKSMMVLLLCNYALHRPLTISCWRRCESRGL